ncbi:MAG TPA: DUF1488 family protein [Alphaproteobacteria bacterium]|nr:DUF1488 family protein [Alphaproteobacteria bacterium]
MVELFTFPDDARWDEAEDAVLFTVQIGEYRGNVAVSRRVLQSLAGRRLKPEECVEQFHMNRTGFERAAEAKVKALDLDEDANIRIRATDLKPSRTGP